MASPPYFNPDGPAEISPGMLLVPTGGRVAYVHASGAPALSDLPVGMADPTIGFHLSVQAALNACRSGRGDRVVCLPGHTENIGVDAWSNLGTKTDIQVIGLGHGTNRPTFTWTSATSSILFDQANFGIKNCRFFMAGPDVNGTALTVAAPITISAPGAILEDVTGRFGFDVDQLVTIGITTTAAADQMTLRRCRFYGNTAATCTTFMDLIGTDELLMEDCVFSGATSAVGVGIVRFSTTAALDITLRRNTYINRLANSTMAVTGLAGVTGVSYDELFHYLDNVSTTMWGTSPGLMAFYNPRTVNFAGEAGMLSTLVST